LLPRSELSRIRFNSDQGSEYTAGLFRQACGRLSVRQSMGRPGSALDNAVIESWHSTVESGLRRLEHFATRAQARASKARQFPVQIARRSRIILVHGRRRY
jgi:putative transposase